MELADIARVLWRLRVLTVLGAPFVVAIALLGTHRVSLSPLTLTPPRQLVGAASAKVLVDSPNSQLVDLRRTGDYDPTILPARVQILADEMAGDRARASLAHEVGLPAGEIAISPFATGPTRTTTLARRLAEINVAGGRPYVVKLSADPYQSILTIATTAPTAKDASRLAVSTIATFTRLVELDGNRRGFIATQLGAPRAAEILVGSGKALTAAIGLFAICAWLFVVIIVGGVAATRTKSQPVPVVKA